MRNVDVGWKIQLLRADDRRALAEHLLRLDETDRRNRFGSAMSDRQLADFAGCCDPDRDIVVVLRHGIRIDGVCHLFLYEDSQGLPVAELGISVDAYLRRAGWAASMLQKALRVARRRYVSRLFVHYLRRNLAMAALMRSLGPISEEWDEDAVTASLPLSALQGRAA